MFLWVLSSCFALHGLFTSSLGSRNVHLTKVLIPLIALLINHQNHSKWHKWCHVRFRSPTSSFLVGSFLVGTSGSIPDKDPFLVPRTCCELCTSTLLVPMIFKDAHIHRPHRGKSQLIAMLYQIQPKPSMYQQWIIENMGARQHERLSSMISSTLLLLCDTTTSPSPSPSPFVILDHTNLHVKARG